MPCTKDCTAGAAAIVRATGMNHTPESDLCCAAEAFHTGCSSREAKASLERPGVNHTLESDLLAIITHTIAPAKGAQA